MSNHRRRDDAASADQAHRRAGISADTPRTLEEELQADAIFQLVCDWAFNELLPDDPRNVPFFEWFAKEARARATPAERADTERRAEEFAKRMVKRWATEIARVDEAPRAPQRHVAPVETQTAQALELAAAERRVPYVDLAVAAGEGRELWEEPCTEWIDLPPTVGAGRHLALRVSGLSMTPLLHDGDTILVRLAERGQRIEPGRIVVARRPDDGYVVKRVGRLGARAIELLSLNLDFPPIRIPHRAGAVLGTVVFRWCPHTSDSD